MTHARRVSQARDLLLVASVGGYPESRAASCVLSGELDAAVARRACATLQRNTLQVVDAVDLLTEGGVDDRALARRRKQ